MNCTISHIDSTSTIFISAYPWHVKYTNGKKKRCSAKMLITHKICSGWAWKFINIVSLIHTFTYQTFTGFHVRLVRHLFLLWKLLFMSSATEYDMQQDQLMQNVSLWSLWFENHFTFVNKYVSMTSHLPENQLLRKNATCKRVMVYAGNIWCFWNI